MNSIKSDNGKHRYDDIINLLHHQSATRSRMPSRNRAAQFSPFAALTGYEEAVAETARQTDGQIELDESCKECLNEQLNRLLDLSNESPVVGITYFAPDKKKSGGSYVTVSGRVKKVDNLKRFVLLEDQTKIPIDSIMEIYGKIFDLLQ